MVPCSLGWLTTCVPNPPLANAAGLAFLLRGNGFIFSRGFGRLCDTLRTAGFWAADLRCTGDRWAVRQVLAAQRTDGVAQPLILVGHSRGGRRAISAATALASLGIAVDLLVCVDVAFPPPIPGNVLRAAHLHRTRHRLYPARPLRAAVPGPRVENLDLDHPESPIPGRGLHHLNITTSRAVQSWIAEQAFGLLGARVG